MLIIRHFGALKFFRYDFSSSGLKFAPPPLLLHLVWIIFSLIYRLADIRPNFYHGRAMLMMHAAGAPSSNCSTCLENNNTLLATPLRCNFRTIKQVMCTLSAYKCKYAVLKSSPGWAVHGRLKSHFSTHKIYSKSHRWLCQTQDTASSDDEYRSSRNIAISLFRRYRNVIDRGGSDNLKEFIRSGVNAYALGCTDEGLRKELKDMKESGLEIEAMQNCGGTTSLKSKIVSEEVDECILWLCIIFITILCTPQPTVVRWSSTPPVTQDTLVQWKGFCAIIANAYFVRGMAWLPVKTLQLEQMAVIGSAEEPSVVASRMRLVFSTLEVVSPQWPRV